MNCFSDKKVKVFWFIQWILIDRLIKFFADRPWVCVYVYLFIFCKRKQGHPIIRIVTDFSEEKKKHSMCVPLPRRLALCGCFFNINTPGIWHKREKAVHREKRKSHYTYKPFSIIRQFCPSAFFFFFLVNGFSIYFSTDAFLQCLIAGPFFFYYHFLPFYFSYPITEINARLADTFN